jgi:asparagine synthase (glutamine-hydrolysing)
MLEALVHRGPDAGGLFEERGIAAGIRRLAVIDVEGGNQPIANEDGTVQVVFNGEIYNYRELRDELTARGHRFRTKSDTEVLVHLWEEDGTRMVERLNGMFAFCVHDRRSGESFLARDRIGIKPLFYFMDGDKLIFASELRALLCHPDVEADVDHGSLVELFCLQYLAGDRTVYRGIRKLLPGCSIHVREGRATVARWWEIPRLEPPDEDVLNGRAGQLRELMDSSVRYRRICDVPLGIFLSGGIDSTVVLALLSAMTERPVRTFSVGFDDARAFDEREFARLAAKRFGAEHRELVLSPTQIAEYLPRLVEHLAEPVTDPALIPTYLLSEFARREVTVVLTGEGADELFGGYRRHLYQQRYGWLSRLPGVGSAPGGVRAMLPRRVEQALDAVGEREPAANYLEWAATIGRRVAGELFEPDAHARYVDGVSGRFAGYFDGPDPRLSEQLRADQHEWLPHNLLAKVDRASMAHSLEARVPYLDHRVVEWAAALPDELKIQGGTTKFILRRAFGESVPERILERGKQGFDLPLADWIRGPLRSLTHDLMTRERLARWEGLRPDAALEMLSRHMDGKQDFGLPLFNIVSILLFL